MSEDFVKYLISRISENAIESWAYSLANKDDAFESGRSLAYYEVLDIIQKELKVNGFDLEEFGISQDLLHQMATGKMN